MKASENKLFIILALTLFGTGILCAQDKTHEGFYLSMALGPAFGDIKARDNAGQTLTISGTGTGFDIQIGGSIKENLILHGNITVKSITAPTVNGVKQSDKYSFGESVLGLGMTYYLPNNMFLTGNIGSGNFSITDKSSTVSSPKGFSYQLKAGKEWWVSSRWALGVAFEYAATSLTDKSAGGSDKWNSNRYGIKFTATLNGKRR